MHTKDTLQIQTESGTIYAAPPRRFTGLSPALPAQLEIRDETFSLSPLDAELLARTIAPQLFETPDPGPLQAIYDELQETRDSFREELNASRKGDWSAAAIRSSYVSLLSAIQGTLDRLEKLL